METILRNVFSMEGIHIGIIFGLVYSLIAGLLFALPLRKRSGFVWRFTAAALTLLLAAAAAQKIYAAGHLHSVFSRWTQRSPVLNSILIVERSYLEKILGVFVVLWFSCDIPPAQRIFAALCAVNGESLTHALFFALTIHQGYQSFDFLASEYLWLKLILFAAVYALLYFLMARRLARDGEYRFPCGQAILILLPFSVFLRIVLTYVGMFSKTASIEDMRAMCILDVMMYTSIAFFQSLFKKAHDWQQEAALEARLMAQQSREFQQFKEDADDLRHLGHDLRHILTSLEDRITGAEQTEIFHRMEKTLVSYESHVDTGNAALDTLLSNTQRRCRENVVKCTCHADGTALRIVHPMDLGVLLGNALDNAVESAAAAEEPEDRYLTLNIWRQDGMAFIRLENYCPTEPVFVDGLPVTTKADPSRHGYGVQSMREIVRRYNGEMKMSAEDHIFVLSIVLPIVINESANQNRQPRESVKET